MRKLCLQGHFKWKPEALNLLPHEKILLASPFFSLQGLRVKSVRKAPIDAQQSILHTQQRDFKKQSLKIWRSLPYSKKTAVPEQTWND